MWLEMCHFIASFELIGYFFPRYVMNTYAHSSSPSCKIQDFIVFRNILPLTRISMVQKILLIIILNNPQLCCGVSCRSLTLPYFAP